MAIQDGGRVMPLDTYARNLAVQLTGRSYWSAASGPEAFAGRSHMELWCDLAFRGQEMLHRPLVIIESAPFKQAVGLDPKQRFFSPVQIGSCKGIEQQLADYNARRQKDPSTQATTNEKQALELQSALDKIGTLIEGEPLAIIPAGEGRTYLKAGIAKCDPGMAPVQSALIALRQAYVSGSGVDGAVDTLTSAVRTAGTIDPKTARNIGLELFYNAHKPWQWTAVLYGLSLVLFGASRLAMRKMLTIAALLVAALAIAEHAMGLGLRVAILGRAPVSNTYEALLWMGLVAIGLGLVAQLIDRKAWYLVAGISVAELSVLFSNLVPLESQTGSLPAVLRSNYWLIVHVLTIVASYGVLAVASILGHVYLVKEVLLARRGASAAPSKLSHPFIAQTYRCMQLGLVLLTAGTILGGVWAADSWGRFWGWDPKETWALISIVVYFIILHARYLGWLKDFGMAASAVLAFASIVWTFYGVNYLMAAGLHSYGFGAGGGTWVAVWAIAEGLFVGICKLRQRQLAPRAESGATAPVGAATNTA